MKTTKKFNTWFLLIGTMLFAQVSYGQWINDGSVLYTNDQSVGIGTHDPFTKLHVADSFYTMLRVEALLNDVSDQGAAGIALSRKENTNSHIWFIQNRDELEFSINGGLSTLFQLEPENATFGNNTTDFKVNIKSKLIAPGFSTWFNGGLDLTNGNQRLTFDPNQMESATKFYLNYYSDKDMVLGYGGGDVGIGTTSSEARLNISGKGYQLRLQNPGGQGATWRIGSSNNGWQAGAGKLVFTHTSASKDATMVMTTAGNVGIGLTTPSSPLHVKGTTKTTSLVITGGADIAEPFHVADTKSVEATPGTVVIIDAHSPGDLKVSLKAYDKAVAGIISGAGDILPGMVMGQEGSIADGEMPVALSGRVFCKVDASYGPIHPGDLLTTSDTPGHAMKVQNHMAAQGAIIGKAMTALEEGTGLVLVLVSLQ